MERQALYEIDDSEKDDFIDRLEFAQRELQRNLRIGGDAWWFEHMIDQISYNSQMLCGVRPYQWDQWDSQREAK